MARGKTGHEYGLLLRGLEYTIHIPRLVGFHIICHHRNAHMNHTIAAKRNASVAASIYFSLLSLNFFILKYSTIRNHTIHPMREKL
jgi:hypothetical protein